MSELLEKILSKDNMNAAYKRVCASKGAGGVDGVTVENLVIISKRTGTVSEIRSGAGSTNHNRSGEWKSPSRMAG